MHNGLTNLIKEDNYIFMTFSEIPKVQCSNVQGHCRLKPKEIKFTAPASKELNENLVIMHLLDSLNAFIFPISLVDDCAK